MKTYLNLERLVENWAVVVLDQFCNICPAAEFGGYCCLEKKKEELNIGQVYIYFLKVSSQIEVGLQCTPKLKAD